MILTHLVLFDFLRGAGAIQVVVATGPLCFEAVQCVSPWVEECEPASPWVQESETSSPWIEEVQTGCG